MDILLAKGAAPAARVSIPAARPVAPKVSSAPKTFKAATPKPVTPPPPPPQVNNFYGSGGNSSSGGSNFWMWYWLTRGHGETKTESKIVDKEVNQASEMSMSSYM